MIVPFPCLSCGRVETAGSFGDLPPDHPLVHLARLQPEHVDKMIAHVHICAACAHLTIVEESGLRSPNELELRGLMAIPGVRTASLAIRQHIRTHALGHCWDDDGDLMPPDEMGFYVHKLGMIAHLLESLPLGACTRHATARGRNLVGQAAAANDQVVRVVGAAQRFVALVKLARDTNVSATTEVDASIVNELRGLGS